MPYIVNDNVFWILEANIKAGQLDELKTLMHEMVAGTQRDEPGALNYEWFIANDGSVLHLYERYADSAAVMAHARNFAQKYAQRFSTYLTITKMTMYGNPSAEVRAYFSTRGAIYLSFSDGFARSRLAPL
jgi:quinol monooxygenase YgiN